MNSVAAVEERQSSVLGVGEVYFASGEESFRGEIIESGTPEAMIAALTGEQRAFVVLPFDPAEPALAHRVTAVAGDLELQPLAARQHDVVPVPAEATYADWVSQALGLIETTELDKVVLGRGLRVESTPALTASEVLSALVETKPGRYIFAVPNHEGTILGASPELLVRRSGTRFTCLPLAGSVPRVADRAEDVQRGSELCQSDKDQREHRYVIDQIRDQLDPVTAELNVPPTPVLISTDTMWHLATEITGEVASADLSAYDLAALMHPTPAMAGVPTETAIAAIRDVEGSSRGALTGAIGWVDSAGNGEFALTIRSGVLAGNQFRLFAGAGIVAGSDPDQEVAETRAKLSTILKAIGAL